MMYLIYMGTVALIGDALYGDAGEIKDDWTDGV